MIIKFNEYITETKSYMYIRADVYDNISKILIEFCSKHFNNINKYESLDINNNSYDYKLDIFTKERLLFNVSYYINGDYNIDINISNRVLDFIYEKNYKLYDSGLSIEDYIKQVIKNTEQDFKLYFTKIEYNFFKCYDEIIDGKNPDKYILNSLVFRKYLQDKYDEMINKYIENNNDNIKDLDLSLCSDWLIKKLEHLKNANNFDLI